MKLQRLLVGLSAGAWQKCQQHFIPSSLFSPIVLVFESGEVVLSVIKAAVIFNKGQHVCHNCKRVSKGQRDIKPRLRQRL